ncbi:MAG: efflux RND transporter permease subunit [Rhodospirillaceae bacterium]|nr:efflux RND transporter permease subunit [Rhodospirillaceae bacterium]
MFLSDFSIKRPVVAIVASLLLIVFGVFAVTQLGVRETPNIERPVVSVRVIYPGASADIVETKIIQVIEDQISGIEGIKSISSAGRDAMGWITIEFNLARDIDDAANDVREQVARAASRLPPDAEAPVVQKADQDAEPILWINIFSSNRSPVEISDYVDHNVRDRISAVEGVAFTWFGGERKRALRVWLDRRAMAARAVTVTDIENALRRENVELGAGILESESRDFTLRTVRSYQTPEDFAQLVIARGPNNYLVRLAEVAKIEIGAESENSTFRTDGKASAGIGVVKRPGASTLAVVAAVKTELDSIKKTMPPDFDIAISQDSSLYIAAALREVAFTMGVAAVLVLVVIYLFLGTLRAALIPAVTVPISLTATFIVLWPMGFSLNILTLLAMVLAIGLVVDDAIIVLENVHRRMKRGEPALLAAFRGTRQVGMAVVATTLVLIAAFVPITLQTGTVGRLFKEFAMTMAAAVAFSMFVALTLTPVLCSKILTNKLDETRLARASMGAFEAMKTFYRKTLNIGLDHPWKIVGLFCCVVASTVVLFMLVPKEFIPTEDRASINVMIRAPEGSSLEYTDRQALLATDILKDYLGKGEVARILQMLPMGESVAGSATNSGNLILRLEPWGDRDRTAQQILAEIAPKLRRVPGAQLIPSASGGMGGAMGGGWGGGSLQIAIGGPTYDDLRVWRDQLVNALRENPRLFAVRSNFNETKAQMRIHIDRTRAADLGVSIGAIGQTLSVMLGSRKVTSFTEHGEEYYVMLQGQLDDRRTPTDVTNIYVRSDSTRELIPLSSLVTIEEFAGSDSLNRLDRMRSITVQANPAPGYTLGEAVSDISKVAKQTLPASARVTWRGEAAELSETNTLMFLAFGLSLVVVFLVMAAQFESFIHPLVILMTVPLAVAGALLGLLIFGSTFNLYSQIGIIVLVGLAAKNGILIVEFTNQLRDAGMEFREALIEACTIRLRPIIMTALATVMGAVPLVLASGAGAEGRQSIGVVIFTGVSLASFITLLVIPVFYMLLAKRTTSPGQVASDLAQYEKAFPTPSYSGDSPDRQPAE